MYYIRYNHIHIGYIYYENLFLSIIYDYYIKLFIFISIFVKHTGKNCYKGCHINNLYI